MRPQTPWEQRFVSTTRGQVVLLLRRARRTVDELALALGLTDNAVRSHLTSLERDGLVTQHGVRKSERKPANVYELTSDAELLFPKAYGRVLDDLLAVLEGQLGPTEVERLLRQVGQRMARSAPPPAADAPLAAKAEVAVRLLNELGGLAEAEQVSESEFVLRGYACPLAEMLPEHPQACRFAETLLQEATGLQVSERCERDGGRPRCRFALSTCS